MNREGLVHALAGAHRTGIALSGAVWRDALADADDAYATQQGVARLLGWFGDVVPRTWKSGAPSRQAAPTHAPLPPAGVIASPADLSGLPFRLPGIEAEIALRLAADVTPQAAASCDANEAAGWVDAMTASIEIVDSRWEEGMRAPPLLRLADLQSHGALVLGAWVPYRPLDWSSQRCRVTIGSAAPVERTGTHPCGDPAWVLAGWLRHATRDGATVAAGTIVTTGTWVGILEVRAGEAVEVVFNGIASACVLL